MAECRISCITDTSNTEDSPPVVPEGKVGKVCKEWLVREDGVLAYRLQTEEISQHYEGNRNKNRTVREDLPLARGMQHTEEEEASAMRLSYERILEQQLEADERVARQMQERLLQQDYSQKRTEEEDERLAKRLAEKERARLIRKRLEREKQQVERLNSQITTTGANPSTGSPNNIDNQEFMGAFAQSIDAMHIRDRHSASLPSDDDELDLSDFCLQPPPNLSPEELRIFLEEQDAEIARLLQQQEMKRKGTVDKEKLSRIEAQDYEIAKLLQKQEKERVRRLKERAKQKQIQKQLEANQTNNTIISNSNAIYNRRHSDNSCDNEGSLSRQSNGVYSGTERVEQLYGGHNQYSDNDSIFYEEIGQSYHPNIATLLDPTYKRNSTAVPPNPLLNPSPNNCPQRHGMESNVDDNDTEEPGIHFAQVYQVTPTPSPSDSPYSTNQRLPNRPMLRDPEPVPSEDNYYPIEETTRRSRVSPSSPVPPYLPVQGQRRISSMEKKKKSKDNCKTQ